jgi:hypothetical protein
MKKSGKHAGLAQQNDFGPPFLQISFMGGGPKK